MSQLIGSFCHPDLPQERLYFVHNTFFEMHETIPMDLATFFWFHISQGITLEGTLFAWNYLETI